MNQNVTEKIKPAPILRFRLLDDSRWRSLVIGFSLGLLLTAVMFGYSNKKNTTERSLASKLKENHP